MANETPKSGSLRRNTILGPPVINGGSTRVEILVSCTNLADMDQFSTSDPFCVLFVKQFGKWKEIFRTEAIKETLNPKFTETFIMDHEDGVQQQLMFSVYDIDNRKQGIPQPRLNDVTGQQTPCVWKREGLQLEKSAELKHHDLIGSVEVALENLIDKSRGSAVTTVNKTLRIPGDPKSRGLISITAEPIKESRSKLSLHIGGYKLNKIGFMSLNKPDVFLEIARSLENSVYHPIYRTEICHKSQHPRWRPFDIGIQKLCNDDWDRSLLLSVFHFNSNEGIYELIGQRTTTVRELQNRKKEGNYQEMSLMNPKKEKQNKKNVVSGTLKIYQIRVDMSYSLLDYIRGGCLIKLMVAIDFTASNGGINEEGSLHCIKDIDENIYVDVMTKLGGLISRYDMDQQVAVLGFGAKTGSKKKTNHCFPLGKSEDNLYVKSIRDVVDLYQTKVPSLKFAGPTILTPVISRAMDIVNEHTVSQEKQAYHVLLLITDGVVNDLDDAVEQLIKSSELPLSILIIGVGPSEVPIMEHISFSSHEPVRSSLTGNVGVRPNMHYGMFKKDGISTGLNMATARECIGVLSTHVLQYMTSQSIVPNKPKLNRSDPQNSWTDGFSLEEDNKPSTTLLGRQDSLNRRTSVIAAPTCPTCGSRIVPGSILYRDTP